MENDLADARWPVLGFTAHACAMAWARISMASRRFREFRKARPGGSRRACFAIRDHYLRHGLRHGQHRVPSRDATSIGRQSQYWVRMPEGLARGRRPRIDDGGLLLTSTKRYRRSPAPSVSRRRNPKQKGPRSAARALVPRPGLRRLRRSRPAAPSRLRR